MTVTLLLFVAGLIILVLGADLLVRGASRLAAAFGVSALAIGLTIVAVGTASPEIAVSLRAALKGQSDLTLGNVMGSNIFNILLILGAAAAVYPIVIAQQLIRRDAPIMLGVSVLTLAMALDRTLGWLDGALLLCGLVIYTAFALRQSRAESQKVQDEYAREYSPPAPSTSLKSILLYVVYIVVGLGLLVLGSEWLVDAAVRIATALGVSELVIGLTIVAIGTSLPEAATSLVAALKKESDIAVGNAVGSNIYNLLGVLGIGALVAPDGIAVATRVLRFDLPVVIFVALVTLPVFYLDSRISRLEGLLLVSYFSLYMGYVVLQSLGSPLVDGVGMWGMFFVVVTFAGLIVTVFRSARRKGSRRG
jgi:cation:H+ antiporter